MAAIKYQLIKPHDNENIKLIANWYQSEWNIPVETTIKKTKRLSVEKFEFQIIMMLDGEPIATGGLYNHVGVLDKEPKFSIYDNSLALVYTKPYTRGKGYGASICKYIQEHAKNLGLKNIYLFTHTAENLYKRLEWEQIERLALGDKDIVVMKKDL